MIPTCAVSMRGFYRPPSLSGEKMDKWDGAIGVINFFSMAVNISFFNPVVLPSWTGVKKVGR